MATRPVVDGTGLQTLKDALNAAVIAEGLRVTAENTRDQSEDGRITAENAREQAEDARIIAESLRVTAENARASNFRTYATFAALSADITGKAACEVRVTADETQGGDLGRYAWSGTKLYWMPMQEVTI
jgi:propanediol dehydratase small subunit